MNESLNEILKHLFMDKYHYDHKDDVVVIKSTGMPAKSRMIQPSKNNRGGPYVTLCVSYNKRTVERFYHRVVWLLCNGDWPNNTIDHIDGNTLNNSIHNLRDVTIQENNINKKIYKRNRVGFKGVSPDKGRYRAQITHIKTTKYLGLYDTPEEAARAYDAKAIELLGDKAVLNFPRDLPKKP